MEGRPQPARTHLILTVLILATMMMGLGIPTSTSPAAVLTGDTTKDLLQRMKDLICDSAVLAAGWAEGPIVPQKDQEDRPEDPDRIERLIGQEA